MSIQKKTEEILAKMGLQPITAEDSLEAFYQVRDSYVRKGKLVYKYDFVGEAFEKDGLIIVPITDVHLGSRQCNIPYFKAFVQYILSVPNCVTILNGDLGETATKVSVGAAMFEEEMNIPEQLNVLTDILRPLAQAGKILGILPGNHEERVANLIGINPMEMLAERLNVPYVGYQGYFRLNVGTQTYRVNAYHGSGGGATSGSRANTAEKVAKIVPNADLYISGHTHGRMWHDDLIYLFDEENENLVAHRRIFAVCGSFLEYGGYSEMKALTPSITGLVRFEFKGDRKDIRVDM
jgi:hypothetical protein